MSLKPIKNNKMKNNIKNKGIAIISILFNALPATAFAGPSLFAHIALDKMIKTIDEKVKNDLDTLALEFGATLKLDQDIVKDLVSAYEDIMNACKITLTANNLLPQNKKITDEFNKFKRTIKGILDYHQIVRKGVNETENQINTLIPLLAKARIFGLSPSEKLNSELDENHWAPDYSFDKALVEISNFFDFITDAMPNVQNIQKNSILINEKVNKIKEIIENDQEIMMNSLVSKKIKIIRELYYTPLTPTGLTLIEDEVNISPFEILYLGQILENTPKDEIKNLKIPGVDKLIRSVTFEKNSIPWDIFLSKKRNLTQFEYLLPHLTVDPQESALKVAKLFKETLKNLFHPEKIIIKTDCPKEDPKTSEQADSVMENFLKEAKLRENGGLISTITFQGEPEIDQKYKTSSAKWAARIAKNLVSKADANQRLQVSALFEKRHTMNALPNDCDSKDCGSKINPVDLPSFFLRNYIFDGVSTDEEGTKALIDSLTNINKIVFKNSEMKGFGRILGAHLSKQVHQEIDTSYNGFIQKRTFVIYPVENWVISKKIVMDNWEEIAALIHSFNPNFMEKDNRLTEKIKKNNRTYRTLKILAPSLPKDKEIVDINLLKKTMKEKNILIYQSTPSDWE